MPNRELIGHVSEKRAIEIEKGQLKLFAKAIGETNPVYFDENAARSAGHPNILAPLTFGNCLNSLAPAKYPTMEELGLHFDRLLHAEDRFAYFLPMHAGDSVTLVTRITDMYEKKGGTLEFLVRETSIHNQKNELVQQMTKTVVMKHS